MKKLNFLAMAALGLLFAACSSDKDVAENGGTTPDFRGKTEGFFKVNINLPMTAASSASAPEFTRAGSTWGEDANLDDGLDKEYQIDNILLLLYEGTSESAATLKQVINLTNTQASYDDTPNQITTRGTYIAKLNNAPTNNLYALAVVNGGTVLTMKDETTITINGSTDLGTSSTIEDLRNSTNKVTTTALGAAPFVYEKESKTYYFMTNAVLSSKQGGTNDPTASPALTTLAPINADCIYESEAAAKAVDASPACEIFVERAMAKVTVDGTITVNAGVKAKAGTALVATLQGWTLDNTNTESFILHKVPSAQVWNLKSYAAPSEKKNITDPFRFVGQYPVLSGASLYRTYWAEDPNYSADGIFKSAESSDFTTAVGSEHPQYCFENTFDVAHQVHKETTRVLVKAELKVSGESTASDFYTVGIDKKTLYKEADVQNIAKTYLMSQGNFLIWWDANKVSTGTTLEGSDITITWSEGTENAGVKTVSSVAVNSSKLKASPAAMPAVVTTLNSQLGKVELYKGGVAYYQIRIKHFGDILTPWNDQEWTTGNQPKEAGINDIYPTTPDQDANYLGRYGMVRNNWYLISLGEIVGLGSSTIPSLPAILTMSWRTCTSRLVSISCLGLSAYRTGT